MPEYRIVDPEVAEELAHQEHSRRDLIDYGWGLWLGEIAMGNPREIRRLAVTVKLAEKLAAMGAEAMAGGDVKSCQGVSNSAP
jgi:hypothetical protein